MYTRGQTHFLKVLTWRRVPPFSTQQVSIQNGITWNIHFTHWKLQNGRLPDLERIHTHQLFLVLQQMTWAVVIPSELLPPTQYTQCTWPSIGVSLALIFGSKNAFHPFVKCTIQDLSAAISLWQTPSWKQPSGPPRNKAGLSLKFYICHCL